MNVSEIVNSAARQLGIVAKGEQLDGEDTQNFIAALQSFLAQWSTKKLYVYKSQDIDIPLTSGKTINLVGDISGDCCEYMMDCCGYVIPRPDIKAVISSISTQGWIDGCCVTLVRDTNVTACDPDVTYVVDAPSWQFIVNPRVNGQSLKIKAYTIAKDLCGDDCLQYPPVYERAIVLTLAIEMADEYGIAPSNTLLSRQAEALKFLKDSNSTPFYGDTVLPIGLGYRRGWDFYRG